MPNIEMHGFSGDQAICKRDVIAAILESIGLDDDAVITVVPSTVTTADRKRRRPQPFIRICGTSQGEIDDIIAAMQTAGLQLDTEWLVLGGFIDAKNMDTDLVPPLD